LALNYVLWRLLSVIPVMAVVAVMVFLLVRLAPGDPAAILAGDNATPEHIEQVRQELGFNRPLWEQFYVSLSGFVRGDLGTSIFSHEPVAQLILQRAEPTVSVALCTLVMAVVIAVLLGVLAAATAGTWLDRWVMGFAALGLSVPAFVIGYLLIFLIAMQLRWLPVQGYTPITAGFGPWLQHMVLPSITLSLSYIALISRITRATMLEVLAEDYIRTADAKGVRPPRRLLRHALKNAAVPIITIVGIGFALLIGGVVITETVFNIPGIGRLVVDAIGRRDYPVIQGTVLVFSAVYVLINLLIDLSYGLFDPRIRY
jgi:peptide/nickel transport system permease protein